jgi:hypothetical protein
MTNPTRSPSTGGIRERPGTRPGDLPATIIRIGAGHEWLASFIQPSTGVTTADLCESGNGSSQWKCALSAARVACRMQWPAGPLLEGGRWPPNWRASRSEQRRQAGRANVGDGQEQPQRLPWRVVRLEVGRRGEALASRVRVADRARAFSRRGARSGRGIGGRRRGSRRPRPRAAATARGRDAGRRRRCRGGFRDR